ncbi:uncharacterized protein [Lepeophtheirus salmonis]|uniref:uncharacterized protein n=1 Tax=Lepeophtheirus salmonis TaxID=72036 RepID=UPI001AE81D62|nr:mucin-5B-like [Lepeophtheirus salmonis]
MNIWIASICILLLASSVSAQTCQTASGPCVFPFIYSGTTYTGCTLQDSAIPWCATLVDGFLNYVNYDYCPASCAQSPIATNAGTCKTLEGIDCIFPFVYQGTSYSSCTNADYGSTFWCATAVGPGNVYTSYGSCSAECLSSSSGSTACQTASGISCVFPFTYNNVKYSSCTSVESSFPWCATSVTNGEYNGRYGFCEDNCEVGVTVPVVTPTTTTTTTTNTTASPTTTIARINKSTFAPSIKTTTQELMTKTTPTSSAKTTKPALKFKTTLTSSVKTTQQLSKITTTAEPLITSVSFQSCQTPTGPCVFPFKYFGTMYTGCTLQDSTLPWCATSVDAALNYLNYNYCPASCALSPETTKTGACKTLEGIDCIFPFVYQGTSYSNCTNADYGSTFWCATAVGPGNVYTSYGSCSAECLSSSSGSTACQTASGISCVFPFTYNNVKYSSCTSVESSFPWCATSVTNGEYNGSYGYCEDNCEVGVIAPV